jgi:hypothetical protein
MSNSLGIFHGKRKCYDVKIIDKVVQTQRCFLPNDVAAVLCFTQHSGAVREHKTNNDKIPYGSANFSCKNIQISESIDDRRSRDDESYPKYGFTDPFLLYR